MTMKVFAKVNRSSSMFIAVLTCLMLAGSISAFAVRQVHTGKAATAVTIVTESELTFIGLTSFQNLAGATATITVPAGSSASASRIQRGLDLSGFIWWEFLQTANSRGWS
jgi:hypothetical protein